jgi:hypothetical protein
MKLAQALGKTLVSVRCVCGRRQSGPGGEGQCWNAPLGLESRRPRSLPGFFHVHVTGK